jgi:DNA-binding NarL/FixJ family response regulator
MDVRMPDMDGVEATRIIHASHPEIKILILTTFSDDEYVENSLRHGAVGYLLKNRPAEELIDSIRALGSGILQIDQAVSARILKTEQKRQSDTTEFRARLQTLSPRERQVLGLMVKARRIAAIAAELGIAEQTVRNHISNLYSKLAIHDRLEIVNYINPIRDYLRESEEGMY